MSVYVSPELQAFADRASVSPVRLAKALCDPSRFTAHLEPEELSKLRASCTARAPRKTDPFRSLTSV